MALKTLIKAISTVFRLPELLYRRVIVTPF